MARGLTLALALALSPASSLAQAQEGVQSSPRERQVEGPELPGTVPSAGAVAETQGETTAPPADPNGRADLAFGAFQRGYYLTALSLALPRAETGDPAAQTLIAEIYWNGHGVPRDRKTAARWYRFAAEGGNREAQFAHANILLRGGTGEVTGEPDIEGGWEMMRRAAEAGHTRAQFNLAQLIVADRPTWGGFKQAKEWYEKAAEAGLADAQYALAQIHAEGQGVPAADPALARRWLGLAAAGGLDTAQLEYGLWLVDGRGGPKNPAGALRWLRRAAAQRNVLAQNRLARMHAAGLGTKRDPVEAAAWHVMSKRAGFSDTDLDRLFQSLPEIDRKRALERANRLGRRLG